MTLRHIGTTLLLALAVTACDSSSDDGAATTEADTTGGGATATTYEPFSQANLQSQLLRVGAYEQIQAIRKGESFAAADFGTSCEAWSGDVTTPTDPTKIGSLYVETAELAAKVAGRQDDHGYNKGAKIGKDIYDRICDAIATGSAVPVTVGKDEVAGIGWYGQVVDKSIQHFLYLSTYHEMVLGARQKWDEGFGYAGLDRGGDATKAQGIAKTAVSRDGNCGTTYARDLHAAFIAGRNQLDAALKAEGKTGNEDALAAIPADLQESIDEIDRMFLEVFAISMAREYVELAAGDEPAIKLIEGRSFFFILQPYLKSVDPDLATKMATEAAKDDPSAVDTALMIGAVKTVFGIDVPGLCTE